MVEIRVHGVSGTPPEAVLDDPRPQPVSGDDTARFLRRREKLPTCGHGLRIVEAFHWGRTTAGSPSKALWLLLAPFGLINLARYTLPMKVTGKRGSETEDTKAARGIADGALRLLGLVLTLLLLTNVTFIALDLIAWQCAGDAACMAGNGWVPFGKDATTGWGLRLLVATIAPSALMLKAGRARRELRKLAWRGHGAGWLAISRGVVPHCSAGRGFGAVRESVRLESVVNLQAERNREMVSAPRFTPGKPVHSRDNGRSDLSLPKLRSGWSAPVSDSY